MQTALVTGGAGFIGSYLVADLQGQGFRVRVLDDFSVGQRDYLAADTEIIEGDVCDASACQAACKDIDVVYHLAARVAVRSSAEACLEDCETNVLGTLRILEAARQTKVRRVVLASSMAVYSESGSNTRISEDHPAVPLSPYGVGKLAAEHYVRVLCATHGMEPVVLRLFYLHQEIYIVRGKKQREVGKTDEDAQPAGKQQHPKKLAVGRISHRNTRVIVVCFRLLRNF